MRALLLSLALSLAACAPRATVVHQPSLDGVQREMAECEAVASNPLMATAGATPGDVYERCMGKRGY